ncbi:MAG: helix-turn-helix transcriptional regulator, partial [Phycisphaerae bacterium]
ATRRTTEEHPYVVEDGRATYVLVPINEYEEFVKASMVQHAIAQIESGDNDFVDADDFALELAAERIKKARKGKGLTQKQLGEKLKLPQSQISRIECNPDRTTVRTLKRIARALGVDVGALI